jgi:hypothetical protein
MDSEWKPMMGRALTGEPAATLADLWSIQSDLTFVAACCDEMITRKAAAGDQQPGGPIDRALWEAAAVAYARCFGKGKGYLIKGRARLRLPQELIDELDGTEIHRSVMDLRDKHIAHRVSDAEQAKVVAALSPPPARAVAGILVFGARLIGKSPEHISDLRHLTESLLQVVGEDMATIQHDLLSWAQSQDLDDVYAGAAPLE